MNGSERQLLLAAYLQELSALGHRRQGIAGLRRRVPWLLRYIEQRGIGFTELTLGEAQAYQGWLLARRTRSGAPLAARTVASYLTAATHFCAFLKARGVLHANPFLDIHRVRAEKKLPRDIPNEAALGRLLDRLADFDTERHLKRRITAYLAHLVAELQYASGLRISEVAALRLDDLDLDRGLLVVRDGKAGSHRIAFLNDFSCSLLRLYLAQMRALVANAWQQRHGELLFGMGYDALARRVNGVLARVGPRCGCPALRSHGFRHAFGYHLLRSGAPIRNIQQLLGHRRLKDTEIYTKVDQQDLQRVLDRCHPRSLPHSRRQVA